VNSLTPEKECEYKIYRGCNHETQLKDEEINKAGKYLQQRYAITNSKKNPSHLTGSLDVQI
jgi:hypothetical protein